MLGLISMMVLSGCGSSSSGSGSGSGNVKPAAAEVKTVYDQVNDDVNYAYIHNTYQLTDGTLSVQSSPTGNPGDLGYPFPLTNVYTLTHFVCGSYIITGSTTAIITAPDYWTSTGTLTASGGDIITIGVNMARNGDPDVMTGTLTVNGYPYDYATGAYK
jgi:hypothetical protein